MSKIVIALGGNALGNTPDEMSAEIAGAAKSIIDLVSLGNEVLITHGNGPQVGEIHVAFEEASHVDKSVIAMELQECTAMSQGYIGFHLQRGLSQELVDRGISKGVVSLITQVLVDKNDPAFKTPTKPIGSYISEAEARELMDKDPSVVYIDDSGRGWRRVVASPKPLEILEIDSIKCLLDQGFLVIASGGGGVPVTRDSKGYIDGIAAVIDKDFSAAKLAETVGADVLIILTAVDRVAINWGKPDQQEIESMTIAQAQQYCDEGQFAPGSMLPKVEAAMQFVNSSANKSAIIASLEKVPEAIAHKSGTEITP